MAIKKRLGEMLIEAGVIDATQLHAALGHQRQWGGRIGACLVELKLASEEAIVDALARKFGFEIARLDRIEPYAFEQARAFVPHEYAVRNRILPISADTSVLVVAMSDPTNLSLADELAFRSGRRVKVCIAGDNAIGAAIRAHYGEEGTGQREAIALDVDDGTAMEPLYDPIGATSSEQQSQFFEQPQPAPPASPPVRQPSAAARAAARAAALAARPRNPSELQLEDQKTGSLPLPQEPQPDWGEEELQPIPLDAEATDEGGASDAAAPAAEPWADVANPEGGQAEPGYAEVGQAEVEQRQWTEQELQLLDALDRLARGDDSAPMAVSPTQLLGALLRVMMRKQWITQQELLDELLNG